MGLIDRYLLAVKIWLPKEQKNDIIAELSEDIHASIQEQEAALGRKLSEPEMEAMLKQRGSPFLVANRFLPQQSLIGPLLFPMYLFVLKIVGVCYAVLLLLVRNASVLVVPALASLVVVTLVFAVLDRLQILSKKLPSVPNPRLIARTGSCIELAVYLLVLVWWAENISSRTIHISAGIYVTLSAVWPWFFWCGLALTLVNIALACVNLVRPYWTQPRAVLRFITDTAGSALFCWLMSANILKVITVTGVSADNAVELAATINQAMENSLPFAIAVCLVIVACDAYRIFRLKNSSVSLPPQAAYFNNV